VIGWTGDYVSSTTSSTWTTNKNSHTGNCIATKKLLELPVLGEQEGTTNYSGWFAPSIANAVAHPQPTTGTGLSPLRTATQSQMHTIFNNILHYLLSHEIIL
jgi:hypothetical protein